MFNRAKRLLNLKDYANHISPIDCGEINLQPPYVRQYVLRMMVRGLYGSQIVLPDSLLWLKDTIEYCDGIQKKHGIHHQFIYITVRHGLVTSTNDDTWHVDGFSMRYEHLPEQNYIYSNVSGTEILRQGFDIPDDFDPEKHHIHQYFQDHAKGESYALPVNRLFVIDPYIVHRRPNVSGQRTFVRISFVPIEIEDDTCEKNPLMPSRTYNREDVRKTLRRYGYD